MCVGGEGVVMHIFCLCKIKLNESNTINPYLLHFVIHVPPVIFQPHYHSSFLECL